MADDWSNLAELYQDDEIILIGKMDCTREMNRPLCLELGVKGHPSLLYGDVVDLKEYKGPRQLENFKYLVDQKLSKPLCGVSHPDLCEPELRQQMEALIALGYKKLDDKIEGLEDRLEELDDEIERRVVALRRAYNSAMIHKEREKHEFVKSSNLALMKQILKRKEIEEKQSASEEL